MSALSSILKQEKVECIKQPNRVVEKTKRKIPDRLGKSWAFENYLNNVMLFFSNFTHG